MVKIGDRVRLTWDETYWGIDRGTVWTVCDVSPVNGSVEIDCEIPVGPAKMPMPWKVWIFRDRFEVVA